MQLVGVRGGYHENRRLFSFIIGSAKMTHDEDFEAAEDADPSSWPRLQFALFVKSFLVSSLGHPHYDNLYVNKRVEPLAPRAQPQELAAYRSTSDQRHPLTWALMILSIFYFFKSVLIPATMFSEIDLFHPEVSFTSKLDSGNNSAAPTFQFACLTSNCSEKFVLSNNWLADQLYIESPARALLRMPIFSMCHPVLAQFGGEFQNLGGIGMYLASVMGYLVFLSGFLLPQLHRSSPAGNLFIMFMVAPRITRRVLRFRIELLLTQMYDSLDRYRALHLLWPKSPNLIECTPMISVTYVRQKHYRDSPTLGHKLPASRRRSIKIDTGANEMEQGTKIDNRRRSRHEFANDCVSVVRSAWWRTEGLKALWHVGLFTISLISIAIIGFLCFSSHFVVPHVERTIRDIGVQMQAVDCTVRIGDNHLDLSQFNRTTSPGLNVLYAAAAAWPLHAANVFILVYYLIHAELFIWLLDIRFQLLVGNEFLRQLAISRAHKHSRRSQQSGRWRYCQPEESGESVRSGRFRLHSLRAKFTQLVHIKLNMVMSSSAIDSQLVAAVFARKEIERHQYDFESGVELLEKLYLSFRAFVEHVELYGRPIGLMITFTQLYNYGIVLINVIYLRIIRNELQMTLGTTFTSWIMANYLMLFATNFHAKARRLHALIWRLLALTCESDDLRVRHLRYLWLKQVIALDSEGGLALHAFSIRMTHTRILQMAITSGTLLVFALRI